MMLLSAVGVFAQKAKIQSVYTNMNEKSCRTLESSAEGSGSYRGECPGIGGYKLQITEGDLRQSIDVVTPQKKRFELDLTGNVSTAFSSVGAKAEWRTMRRGRTIVPMALIVRYNASENQEDAAKETSYLVVVKITKTEICVTDVLKPGAGANIKARQFADESAAKPCKVSAD